MGQSRLESKLPDKVEVFVLRGRYMSASFQDVPQGFESDVSSFIFLLVDRVLLSIFGFSDMENGSSFTSESPPTVGSCPGGVMGHPPG
jgi:hypothetical protein